MIHRVPRLPAAVAAAFSSGCAVWAATSALDSSLLLRWGVGALALGYLTASGAHWWPVIVARTLVLVGLGWVARLCYLAQPPPALAPFAAILDEHNGGSILLILAFAVVALSWVAGSSVHERRVPMSLPMVPGLSIFGLAAVFTSTPLLQVAFLAFTLGALYTMAYEHCLGQRESATGGVLPTFVAAAGVATGYLALLLPLSLPVAALGRNVAVNMSSTERQQLRDAILAGGSGSGYSRFGDTVQMGGDVRATGEEPVLELQSPVGALLRGKAYDVYIAGEWRQSGHILDRTAIVGGGSRGSTTQVRLSAKAGLALTPPAGALPPREHARRVSQSVKVLAALPGEFYCAGTPVHLKAPRADICVDSVGSARTATQWEKGETYSVVSVTTDVDEDVLEAAPGGMPPDGAAYWLQIPQNVVPLRDLALSAAGSARTPYARAAAVAHYLRDHCRYSLGSGGTPAGTDPIHYFVTEGRKGACDLFAGAMVVMCRSVGVPARMVTGYLPREATGRDRYVVRQRDAHAWAEVYVAPYGWVAYDPTPSDDGQGATRAAILPILLRIWNRLSLNSLVWAVEGLLLLVALVAFRQFRLPRRRHDPAARFRPAPGDRRGAVQQAYHQACRHLARRGFERAPGQTPEEYLEALAPLGEEPRRAIAALTRLFEEACYASSGAPVDADAARRLAQAVRRWKGPQTGKSD